MVELKIAGLDDGAHEFVLEPSAADLDVDPNRFREIRVEVRLDKNGPTLVVDFDVIATATMECARTLDEFHDEITGAYTIVAGAAHRSAKYATDEAESTDYEFIALEHEQESIDITSAVRDTLLLAVPVRPLSPQGQAAEIPLSFGKDPRDDQGDPRWDALRSLRQ